MHEAWSGTLRTLFSHYTPIFVGYGGNDESLMGQMESLAPDEIKGRLIWCYYRGEKKELRPNDRIQKLVAQHHGVMVGVPDFDRFMILLGASLALEPLDHVLEERAKNRQKDYQDAILGMRTDDFPKLIPALRATYKRANAEWWSYQLEVNAEPDAEKKDARYRSALDLLPTSVGLLNNYVRFLALEHKDYARAARLAVQLLDLDVDTQNWVCNASALLIASEQFSEAAEVASKYSGQVTRDENGIVLQFHSVIRKTLEGLNTDSNRLALRAEIEKGFERTAVWTFDLFWDAHGQRLAASDLCVLKALGDAIADPSKVADLDAAFRGSTKKRSATKRASGERSTTTKKGPGSNHGL